ncbi:peptidoglycan-binding protein [Streptomyces sp. NPDC007991]|uniref:peptidoglycan-binding domain-containing protein n=1 Tax=Streptomyces sp. NPDC007991 TaxID=3364803 RepID=UPI0036E8CAF2
MTPIRTTSRLTGTVLAGVLAIGSLTMVAAPAGVATAAAAAYKCDRTYYTGNALTSYGDSGNRVIEAQCRLVFYQRLKAGDVDGRFGPKTRNAVIAFQQGLRSGACGKVDVDGIVGPVTWYFLRHGCG